MIKYPGDVSTPTEDTTTAKIVINSTISTPKAKYLVGDGTVDDYFGSCGVCGWGADITRVVNHISSYR